MVQVKLKRRPLIPALTTHFSSAQNIKAVAIVVLYYPSPST